MTSARHRTSAPRRRFPATVLPTARDLRAAGALLHRPGAGRRAGASALLLCLAGAAALSAPVAAGADPEQLTALEAPTADVAFAAHSARAQAVTEQVSRDAVRAAPEAAPVEVAAPLAVPATTVAYALEDVDVLAEPAARSARLGGYERGASLAVTGTTEGAYSQVALGGGLGWVRADALSADPPPKISGAPCPGGSGVESGLRASTIGVHRAVCAQFPGLVYGGLRPGDDGDHGTGRALDIMIRGERGDALALWLQQNSEELGIYQLIWKQRIWYAGSSFDSWSLMENRGSETANHFDHVHVSMP